MKGFPVGTLSLLLVSGLCYANVANAQLTSNLTVEVIGLQSQEGNVCLKLFSGSQGFPNDNESAVQRICVAIAQEESTTDESMDESMPESMPETITDESMPESITDEAMLEPMEAMPESIPAANTESTTEDSEDAFIYTFENIPSGTYAVAIYHDSNGDEVLNRGAFGMPTEGYGFSNDAPATDGPPRYSDAVVLVAGTHPAIQIQMKYPQ